MDLSLLLTSDTRFADLFLNPPGLLTGNELESAILMSLFTDRRANDDDPLSLNQSRRGWWADTYAAIPNDKIGSRLWLLERAKMTQDTLNRAQEYATESLQWLISDNVATSIAVETEFLSFQIIGIGVTINKPSGAQTFNFSYVWNNL